MKITQASTDRNREEHQFSTSRKSTKITSGNIRKHSRIYVMSPRCSLKLPRSILWSSNFHDFLVLSQNDSGISIFPVKMGTWRWYHRKKRQKLLGLNSGCFIWWSWARDIVVQRGSGTVNRRTPPWGNLAPPADLEESASHHFQLREKSTKTTFDYIYLHDFWCRIRFCYSQDAIL